MSTAVTRQLVVIGGSAGAWQPVRTIVAALPADFPAAVAIAIHRSPYTEAAVAAQLSAASRLPVIEPADRQPLLGGHVYIAPMDRHLKVEDGEVFVERTAREHHARPAVDALFRSAARAYGPSVTALLLSGMGVDGSAGVMAVRAHGGVVVLQDPADAEYPFMPEQAASVVEPDYTVRVSEVAGLLVELVGQREERAMDEQVDRAEKMIDADLAAQQSNARAGMVSTYSCPDCGGVLWQTSSDAPLTFACHTGHRWAADSLIVQKTDSLEAALFEAVRLLKEKAMLLRQVAGKASREGESGARLREQAELDESYAALIRKVLLEGEPGALGNWEAQARNLSDVARNMRRRSDD